MEGVANLAYTQEQIRTGRYRVVAGEGQRWLAVQFPNGRYGVLDMEAPGSNMRAAGLTEATAVGAVTEANATGRFHPTMTMR